ncbi:MAG: universal stress protein, partial [Actinobacteria bacterium]|nr:universal stress protein [Actinomycetota bacterium]
MKGRLVVGYDGSEASLTAVRWTAAEAEIRGASVRVMSSYALPPVMDFYGIGATGASIEQLEAMKKSCEAALHDVVERTARERPTVGFDLAAVDVPPVHCLVAAAADADLLVVGSNGLGAVREFILGSVTGAVLHDSPCPVVVVPQVLQEPVGKIVVGVDGSETSTLALRWAAAEADRRHADLIVLHAWEYPYRMTSEGFARGSSLAEIDAEILLEESVSIARNEMTGTVFGRLAQEGAAQA